MEKLNCNFEKMEKLKYGKIIGKHKYSKGMGFLHISREKEIHAIPKRWDDLIPVSQKKYGKSQTFPRFCSLTDLELMKWMMKCRNRNKFFLLVFTSVVLFPIQGQSEYE